ncbi:MAG TPA: Ig-like domain-containing protein [Anaeromyxobacteraceae bacterium]|nr:Ig-like domain-containing protein [Anaeromyxobacteraceae bacterium]
MRRSLAPTALALLLAACGGSSGTTTPTQVPVATVTVTLASGTVATGLTTTATATLRDASGNVLTGRTVTWSSSASGVATVSASGLVSGVGAGAASITATSEGKAGTATVTVVANPVASVAVSLATNPLPQGSSTQAVAVTRDAAGNVLTGRTVTWTSSDTTVATVSAAGLVAGVNPGAATITGTSEGVAGSVALSVNAVVVGSVTVSLSSPVLGIGKIAQGAAVARDPSGAVLAGRAITWTSSAPAVATVSATGVVTAVSLGTATITATTGGKAGSATVTVQAVSAVTALHQTVAPGAAVLQPPGVRVTDGSGAALAGVAVNFAVTAGGGVVTGGSATTGADGVARATTWTLGASGAQSVRATVPSVPGVSVDFSGTARAPGAGYDISFLFLTPMSDSVLRAFVDAKERIQEFVIGDVEDAQVNVSAALMAQCGGSALNQVVDDVLIVAEVTNIDGVGNILGQAGPCFVRSTGTQLPVVGHMMFDSADLANLDTRGALEATILHEMMHVLGFGTIWDRAGLIVGSGGLLPSFSGAQALASFVAENGGASYPGTPVPVEGADAGVGTANSHWREVDFDDELMTGFLDVNVPEPLSATTIGSMKDLGYTVDLTRADPFHWGTATVALRAAMLLASERVQMVDDVRRGPVQVLGPDGTPLLP